MCLGLNLTLFLSSIWYNFFSAIECEAPVSAHTAAFTPQILRIIKLDGAVGDSNVNKLTLFKDAFASPLDLEQVGHLDYAVWQNATLKGNPCSEDFDKTVSVLGLKWNLSNVTLSCDFKDSSVKQPVSKRNILSIVHRSFDPTGFTAPDTLITKLMLQECWKQKISWDNNLPKSLSDKFESWKNKLHNLEKITIPRRFFADFETISDLSLHVFCDASKSAYATCIFMRNCNENSVTSQVQLISGRSRVAPIKPISIPRLELFACTIGARLAHRVKEDLRLETLHIYYWSDSMDALFWIKKKENWAVFVHNRVKEIRTLSNPNDWNYIPGTQNPADLPSRGCSPETLVKSKWWEGPDWLRND
ncbi:uncharacterized protein LOC118191057 [Stegodyphus dumicola]|uniref:uncharacterized protein LOC118191057 n=1 Tax=Stegodyphus dumicola TaxID=202533 RepID=UPI0015A96FBD|nr:uncharacterized protein LOC118191057 [Stegodyphus dumicola]